jgi:hypothetical protein
MPAPFLTVWGRNFEHMLAAAIMTQSKKGEKLISVG